MLRCSSSWARVMPTKNSRRSSSTCSSLGAAALVRQETFFDGDDEHDGKLQPLAACSVIKVDAVVVDFPGIGIVDQAGLLEKSFQAVFAGVLLVVLARGGEQLFDVRQPLLIFLGVAVERAFAGSPSRRGRGP